ncbi:TetR/AcrR family transcriptional regulator [Streptomyces sp. CBMA123]|uniref:TetR/AcrR family transcriptional regulator n=1 Tax=Streptomyces sp. CBMA123 TaxID=1896313 RepID=UPI001661A769|nr:TetR/AcrR family transcriptional regulator [Streptomyces sp. CBMA123]MBD0689503.1 TetR family transcriptional regulator [Streptomyces sp. CBMA123]
MAEETPRERYRAQVREEVKRHAREQIATAGASALSLNAIAKQMGLSGPALYRYFAGRDELITALVRDAYRSLADTLKVGAEGGADLRALAHALRLWALADPQRYFLIYGTPVPGYHAPEDTTAISGEIMTILLDACVAVLAGSAAAAGAAGPTTPESTPAALAAHLADHRDWTLGHPAPPEALHRFLSLWTRLHGVLSLELAGHFTAMGFDPALLYAAELDDLLAPRG